ncbi:MAG: lantibiotic ABC transporter permease [Firmicutes bacterium HGW-Firmicutes-16]|nr:MAG: lantibiotic ABC transporter permease [Firmicutes bacterium HGW-Firmicutes-16]
MKKKNVYIPLKLIAVVTFIIMVTVNALSALLPLNGLTPGEVSDSFPNLFAPAGITFSIWGLIYLLLTVYTLYLLGLFQGKENHVNVDLLRKTGIVFSISSLINAAWIFSWHYKIIPLSMVLMVFLLICLIDISVIIDKQGLSPKEKLLIRLPFAVYFGWITVATIANATVLLVSLGWSGFGLSEVIWTIIILAIGALICVATLLRFKSTAYGLVLVWAYTGILIKHTSTSGFSSQYPGIIIAISICLVLFTAAIVYVWMKNRAQNEAT